jgi:carbonic anhydrase
LSTIDDLLANNRRYAAAFPRALPPSPAKRLAVVACMDARLNVYGILGLAEGDAHVISNAGGVVTDDTVRSLAISQRVLGTTAVALVHHTECGMLGLRDDEFVRALEDETGQRPPWAVESFRDLDDDVRESMARITASPFVPHTDEVRGFVFDVATGLLREVGR